MIRGSFMQNSRLILEMKIMKFLVERYGLTFLFRQRYDGLYLPSPREFAGLLGESKNVAEHIYYDLQQESVLSLAKKGLKLRYHLSRPQAFVSYLQTHLIKKLGTPKAYSLPRELREKPSNEILELINKKIDGHEDAVLGLAIMHTAYLLPNQVYERAKIYRGKTPLCLLLGNEAMDALKMRIGIKSLPIARLGVKKKGNEIPFPVNLDQPDLIIFEKGKLKDFMRAFGMKHDGGPILAIDHVVNLLLLPFYPVRGIEAQERLAEILHGLYVGEKDE